jgi:tRNA (guanine37-N1)-methyltransferase
MNISILSVFPDLYNPFLQTSLVRRAQEQGHVTFDLESFFSYAAPKERIDAPTFGHGAGMLIKPEVVQKAIEDKEQRHGKAFKIFFSPHGKKLDQTVLQELAAQSQSSGHLMLLPARYEGMDTRVEQEYADAIISVGDFVLMGGDIPAMILLEGLLRLIPGVVGKQESVERESFSGALVDYPEYTEPVEWKGIKVPDVVRSGNHEAIRQWRMQQAAQRTILGHFDWARGCALTPQENQQLQEALPAHYVLLNHGDVMVGRQERIPGTTSVTSIDMHDIARSSKTYGIKNFFLVTPLLDQQKVITTLLDFWQKGAGIDYNKQRHEAVKSVRMASTVDEVIAQIEQAEGARPLVIATSARAQEHHQMITFYDQHTVWALKRPVLFVFGTGQGLTPEFINQCDFLLPPVGSMSDFNHLSVRSAVAVVLDRWLGLSPRHIKPAE